jgi:hypothetical protein
MTLPAGQIAMSDINAEMSRAWNTPFTLNDADVRNLAYKPSGPISLADFRGKQRLVTFNASNPYNQDLYQNFATFGGAGAFGGALASVWRDTVVGGPDGDRISQWVYTLIFNGPGTSPSWYGSLYVVNNNTGVGLWLSKISETAWRTTVANGGGYYDPGPYYNLVRGQSNDSFTIVRGL